MMSKYNARSTIYNGYKFDSLAEAHRYGELCLLQQAGQISALSVHPLFYLQPSFIDNTGKRQRAIKYEADFAYIENGKKVVEDVKGVETPVFKLKAKIFKKVFPNLELRIIR